MKDKIITREDLNTAVTQLRAYSIQMCNDTNAEDVYKNFTIAKDLLMKIYKYNIDRTKPTKPIKKI